MIVQDIATIEKHIAVNSSFEYTDIKPYLKRAERTFLSPLLGKAQLLIFENTPTDETVLEALDLVEEAICNHAYYLYLPIGEVQVTSGGILVQTNANSTPATPAQIKSLQRSFKSSAHETLDELLEFMEANTAKFTAWTESVNFAIQTELLVNRTSIFNAYYSINYSRQAFISLLPTMRLVEDQYIKTPIQEPLLKALKSLQTDPFRDAVKRLLQKSIVASTVAKTVENGVFVISSESMHMRFDMLPYENKVSVMSEFLASTRKNKEIEAQQYLSEAIKTIKENLLIFTEYVPVTSSVTIKKIYITPGITALF